MFNDANALKLLHTALANGFELTVSPIPESGNRKSYIVATLLHNSFEGGAIPPENRCEFEWGADLLNGIENFAYEVVYEHLTTAPQEKASE